VVHEILELLAPLILQYDAVLHTDLMVLRKNYASKDQAYRVEHPGFIGSSLDPLLWDRFNAHLNRFCDNASAMRAVRLSMETTLNLSRHTKERSDFTLPENTSILNPRHLGDNRRSRRSLHLPAKLLKLSQPWSQLTQFIASGFSGTDGCWFYPARGSNGAAILVNWDRLLEIAKHQNLDESPLTRILAFTSPTAGYEAKNAYSRATQGRLIYSRKTPLSDYIVPTGLPVPAVVSHPWEIYSATAISAQLQGFNKSDEGIRRARITRKRMPGAGEAKPKQFKVVYADYGNTTISIVRRKMAGADTLLFSLPYTPDDLFDVQEYRKDKSLKIGPYIYWSTRGINQHANGILTGYLQAASEPEARAFLLWTAQQEARLYGPGFKRALFEQARPMRIGEYTRGDRKSMGFFTEFEDGELDRFFQTVPAGKLDTAAREYLRRTLPGRSDSAINRRREYLGYKYALQFGWAKYCQSGYCANRSQKRKAKWLKSGVTL
jgi:hypothetical protein